MPWVQISWMSDFWILPKARKNVKARPSQEMKLWGKQQLLTSLQSLHDFRIPLKLMTGRKQSHVLGASSCKTDRNKGQNSHFIIAADEKGPLELSILAAHVQEIID